MWGLCLLIALGVMSGRSEGLSGAVGCLHGLPGSGEWLVGAPMGALGMWEGQ